ncbi:MAG: hypothetical protein B6D34_07540 [Candidatus Brocadia sp. UTAMX1]|jgi:UDP-glucuronate 4-epimerase|nr:MAG: hypothetical protein B6D34_07540 [Candidatus Brocadia sp. UTAMX1]
MRGDCVVGIDNPNNYGDVNLKLARLKQLEDDKNRLPIRQGDVPAIYGGADDLINDVGFKPNTPIETSMKHFVEWENSLLWQIISYLNRES